MGNLRFQRSAKYTLVEHVALSNRRDPVVMEKVVQPSQWKWKISTSPSKEQRFRDYIDEEGGMPSQQDIRSPSPKRVRPSHKVIIPAS